MSHPRLWSEFLVLYALIPGVVFAYRSALGFLIIPILLTSAGVMAVILWRDEGFDRRQLWNAQAARSGLAPVLKRFALGAPLLALGVYLVRPDLWLNFPRSEPLLWGDLIFTIGLGWYFFGGSVAG